jgi:hypothetical protein
VSNKTSQTLPNDDLKKPTEIKQPTKRTVKNSIITKKLSNSPRYSTG